MGVITTRVPAPVVARRTPQQPSGKFAGAYEDQPDLEVNPKKIALRLNRIMCDDGLYLIDVAKRTGVSERTLRKLLRAEVNPHARTLHRLATGLGVTSDELIGCEPKPRVSRYLTVPVPRGGPREMTKADICNVELLSREHALEVATALLAAAIAGP